MHLSLKQLQEFLNKYFNDLHDVEHLGDGWWSQAFSFYTGEQKFVIRISKHLTDFKKDRFAHKHFSNKEIPIPRIMETGPFNKDLFYCISEYSDGTPSDQVIRNQDPDADLKVASKLLRPLYLIHELDTTGLSGWGITDANGHGSFKSWPDYLFAVHNPKYPISWTVLAQKSWLDQTLFTRLLDQMKALFIYLPSKKQVLHGDYGFDNLLLTPDHEVSAVIDWAEMTLGDALYDLIHMNEPWRPADEELNYLTLWEAEMKRKKQEIVHLKERLECYQIHYTLFHLHIHTARQEEEEYMEIAAWAKKNLL